MRYIVERKKCGSPKIGGFMIRYVISVLALLAASFAINACQNPDYVFSVMFKYDSSYPVDLSLFKAIGEEDVNFFHDSMSNKDITMSNLQNVYSYRSHYNDFVLIEVAAGGINFVADTSGTDLTTFKADLCIDKELEWLNYAGIVQTSRVEREAIAAAFSKEFKSKIFWTCWDTLTGSDMKANADGTFERERCSSDFTLKFPQKPLESTGIHKNNDGSQSAKTCKFSAGNDRNSIHLVDIRGRKIQNTNNLLPNNASANIIIRIDSKTNLPKRIVKIY